MRTRNEFSSFFSYALPLQNFSFPGLLALVHEPQYETDEAQTDGRKAAIHEIAEVILVDGVAELVHDEENAASDGKEVEKPSYDFDKDFHSYRV